MTKNLKYVFYGSCHFFTLYELILAAMILIRQQVLMFRHLCLILAIGLSCLADSLHCPYRVVANFTRTTISYF